MGRSVNYLNNAVTIIYFTSEYLNSELEGEIFAWEDFVINLKYDIMNKLKSYVKSDKWDNQETQIILENELCNIGISEYCGLYSLSVAPIDFDGYYPEDNAKINFAEHHAKQIEKTLCKILKDNRCTVLNRLGTFSNGEGVYEKAKV